MPGPLDGIRVIELAAIGPAPFGVMLLGDLGAEVIRIDRTSSVTGPPGMEESMRGMSRNRRSIAVDLKNSDGRDIVRRLAASADVFVEGWRPGVAERLGLGPVVLHTANEMLVYARMTGWGQDGPLAQTAGHDIDYAAVAGALHPTGRAGQPPAPPLNYIADFGGGGAYLVIGILAALVEREQSGRGQVVDAAMIDGAISLTAMFHGLMAMRSWTTERQSNLLDGGAPFYDTYATADEGFVAVGSLEPQFYAELLARLELDPADWPQFDESRWPAFREELTRIFASGTREHWNAVFDGSDACVASLQTLREAPKHPHNVARNAFVTVDGHPQPAPAPRFSRTPGQVVLPAPDYGEHTDEIMDELGYGEQDIWRLRYDGAIA